MALVNYGDSDISDSDEELLQENHSGPDKQPQFHDKVEDEYKMRIPKNAKPLIEPLNIQRRAGSNGKIILSIPTVEEFNSSDESDSGDEGRVKKPLPKPSGSKASKSLLDLLPPTQALIVREGDKPVMSSPLVPRQATRKAPAPKPKPSLAPTASSETNEDDDDDDGNNDALSSKGFFTFSSTNNDDDADAAAAAAAEARKKAREAVLVASRAAAKAPTVARQPDTPSTSSDQALLTPLREKPFSDWELQAKRPRVDRDGDVDEEEEEEEAIFTAETFIPGPERKRARLRQGVSAASVAELLGGAGGGVSVREVRAEDLTAGAQLELLKNITAARPPPPSASGEPTVQNPGKLAFRKHQITWLAYQAQEREYELQERWAEARRNQANSRQKYGF